MCYSIMKEPKNHFYIFLILILIGSSIPGDSVPSFVSLSWDKLLHVVEYSFLGFLGYRAYHKEFKFPIYYIITFGLFFGIFDETLQSFIPGRFSSHYDVIADVIGVICGVFTGASIYKDPI